MHSKKWIVLWFLSFLTLTSIVLIIIKLSDVPLRFSSSISYDAKLNFLHDNQLINRSDTLVVGSSMAINNVDAKSLEENSNTLHNVINLASWGLQSADVTQLIQLIDLKKIKYIVYSTQYVDFYKYQKKDIDEEEVKKYINREFSYYPYLRTIEVFFNNIDTYINFKKIYEDKNRCSYLNFDKRGSVLLDINNQFIIKDRWFKDHKNEVTLSDKSLNELLLLNSLAKKNNIKLIVITSPIKEAYLNKSDKIRKVFNEYVTRLKRLSEENDFLYYNANDQLKLTDSYFVDGIHLHKRGAEVYSRNIAQFIDKSIN